jgi:hypothetical protein
LLPYRQNGFVRRQTPIQTPIQAPEEAPAEEHALAQGKKRRTLRKRHNKRSKAKIAK